MHKCDVEKQYTLINLHTQKQIYNLVILLRLVKKKKKHTLDDIFFLQEKKNSYV